MSDLAEVAGVLADVEEVDRVVVAWFVDERVVDVGVLPCLWDLEDMLVGVELCGVEVVGGRTYGTIDKRITPMRPHRLYESRRASTIIVENWSQRHFALDFDRAVSPAGDFDDGVDDGGVILVWIERDLEIR